jgi:hypothetical protein
MQGKPEGITMEGTSMGGARKRSIKIPIAEALYEDLEKLHNEEGRPLEALIEEALLEYREKHRRGDHIGNDADEDERIPDARRDHRRLA